MILTTYHGHQIEEKKNSGVKSKLTKLAQVSPLVSNGGWPQGASSPAGSHLIVNWHFFFLQVLLQFEVRDPSYRVLMKTLASLEWAALSLRWEDEDEDEDDDEDEEEKEEEKDEDEYEEEVEDEEQKEEEDIDDEDMGKRACHWKYCISIAIGAQLHKYCK